MSLAQYLVCVYICIYIITVATTYKLSQEGHKLAINEFHKCINRAAKGFKDTSMLGKATNLLSDFADECAQQGRLITLMNCMKVCIWYGPMIFLSRLFSFDSFDSGYILEARQCTLNELRSEVEMLAIQEDLKPFKQLFDSVLVQLTRIGED